MPVFVGIVVIFILAAIGIVCYYKFTPEGRTRDVDSELSEAHLQNRLVDTIVEIRETQRELRERMGSLK